MKPIRNYPSQAPQRGPLTGETSRAWRILDKIGTWACVGFLLFAAAYFIRLGHMLIDRAVQRQQIAMADIIGKIELRIPVIPPENETLPAYGKLTTLRGKP